jgi:calcineurin-like phosphoesterase family protein
MSENIWFTADTHFNHARIIVINRPRFASVEEMNETLIERWNARVKPGDRVYHLGDFALGRPPDSTVIASRLHGQIYLVRGNHEKVAEHPLVRGRFVWIKDYFGLKVGTQKIYLCHYAFRTWNGMHHGSWHLHGHSHGTLEDLEASRSFDVGVDCWDFAPVAFEQVAARMASKRFDSIDHHEEGRDDVAS